MCGRKVEAKTILETMKTDYRRSQDFEKINESIEKLMIFCN
jgi:hypothetical protein